MSYEVTFADNTEVTLENMDNIVRDLGDAEFSEFSTNKFGVNTLNSITSDLVSAGILRTEENANMGCEPIIDGTNVIIRPGVIVFDTGAKLRITEAETFVKTNSTYIYAKNDHITGLASIVMSETAPTNEMDAVSICRIDTSGNLIDLRRAAVAKIQFTADLENVGVTKRLQFTIPSNSTYLYDFGFNGWKYIIFRFGDNSAYIKVIEMNDSDQIDAGYFPKSNNSGRHAEDIDPAYGICVTRIGESLEFRNIYNYDISIDVVIEVR